MFDVSTEVFNLVEGFFWIILGVVCLILYFRAGVTFKKLSAFSAVVLITFGVSDFMQVTYGSFLLPHMQWLFMWKILDVIGLLSMIVWYIVLRLRPR